MEFSNKYFSNTSCQYFPCHKTKDRSYFNCLFCYCPLYLLGEECGGNFNMANGVKDCTNCLIPHKEAGYDYINEKLREKVFSKK